jgi:histidinol-phosphatase
MKTDPTPRPAKPRRESAPSRPSSRYRRELETAEAAARAAGRHLLDGSRKLPAVELKGDRSPVTRLDRESEAILSRLLLDAFPSDGLLGEECGEVAGSSGRRWIVDPLDGTRPFLRGIPTYSVLVALEEAGEMVVGCMFFPVSGECYTAAKGRGAFRDGRRIRVSRTPSLDRAMLAGLGPRTGGGKTAANLRKLLDAADYAYGFMDAYSYALVASGRLDAVVSIWDKPWDCAAAACIVREAGGRFSDLSGAPDVHTGVSVASNGLLHEALLRHLKGS